MNDYDTRHMDGREEPEIFEYIRRRRGGKVQKVGVIYGTQKGDTITIGWSKCNVKEGDIFNSEKGIDIAKKRASLKTIPFFSEKANPPVPLCIKRHIRQFGSRCLRYFKDANKLELPL